MLTSYTVRFSERRPNGRLKPLLTQKVGPATAPEVWRWVAEMLRGSTPDVLDRLQEIKLAPEEAPVTEEVKP